MSARKRLTKALFETEMGVSHARAGKFCSEEEHIIRTEEFLKKFPEYAAQIKYRLERFKESMSDIKNNLTKL